MDKLLFVIMIGLLIFISMKNISVIKRYKQNKSYIECYQNVLHGNENADQALDDYIEKEKSIEFINKAKIIKLYSLVRSGSEYENTLNEINLKDIFYRKDKVDIQLTKLNSDAFIFIMLVMVKAYEVNNIEVIDKLVEKLNETSELQEQLEYQEILAFANALTKKEDNGSKIMHSLLDGTYTEYRYEKNMIGLYKRVASTTLAFNNEEFDEYFKQDLHKFAQNFIGEIFLKGLGLYETYKPEEVEETKEEVVEEIKEENIEEENK